MTAAPLRSVVVAGGGLAGWSAAAALKRRVPSLAVTIMPIAPPADSLADRTIATLPSIAGFHADIGIGEEDTVARTGSGYRLGTRYAGWASAPADYIHAYDQHGRALPGGSFHLHWARAAAAGQAVPFDAHAAAAVLARQGRFAPAAGDAGDPFAGFEYGLHLDLAGYATLLRAFARHCGVIEDPRPLRAVKVGDRGWIDALTLDDGHDLSADLFVDATGPAARLRGRIDDRRDDWSRWFGCDRILFADAAPPATPLPLDDVIATDTGWRWHAASPRHGSAGMAYSSRHASDDTAAAMLAAAGATPRDTIPIHPGHRPQPWRGNCVAIGEAATVIEPLEWTALHLAHSAIDRLIAMLPDRDCATVEAADYNRQTAAEANRVRDFVLLHYATAQRDEPFWRERAAAAVPDSLAHTLVQFRARGRLPFYEEETFARDSWLAVLYGQGERPQRLDPVIATTSAAEARAWMARWQQALATGAAARPTLSAYLDISMRQLAR